MMIQISPNLFEISMTVRSHRSRTRRALLGRSTSLWFVRFVIGSILLSNFMARSQDQHLELQSIRSIETTESPSTCSVSGQCTNDNSEKVEEEDDDEKEDDIVRMTEHERLQAELHIPFPSSSKDINDLGSLDSEEASKVAAQWLLDGSDIRQKLKQLFEKAKTKECREKIAQHFGYFMAALGREVAMPFTYGWYLNNTCTKPVLEKKEYDDDDGDDSDDEPVHPDRRMKRHTDRSKNASDYIDHHDHLKILYAILTHDDPQSTIRLIEALYEPGHVFIVHVDGKPIYDGTYHSLVQYAITHQHVHVLAHPYRIRVNWGGFTMVNATLHILKYAFGLLVPHSNQSEHPHNDTQQQQLIFHKVVHLSSTTYPIASNTEIRVQLSQFPLDTNLMHLTPNPIRHPPAYYYFVECDDAVHRIHHLDLPSKAFKGLDLFSSSQWWIISREFAHYLAAAERGTFVRGFLDFAEHVVVSDETFFGTVLKNTHFCRTLHLDNFNYVEFDRWESQLQVQDRDLRKCPMKDPNYCGRSASTMMVEDAPILELNDNLFARKFASGENGTIIKDIVDRWRADRDLHMKQSNSTDEPLLLKGQRFHLEGHGVLIVAKETVRDEEPLCLGVDEDEDNYYVYLTPCFHDSVVPTLVSGWETGTVALEEAFDWNRWDIQACSTNDGHLEYRNGSILAIPAAHSITGPRCSLQLKSRSDSCLELLEKRPGQIGGSPVYVESCSSYWTQLVSFGDGKVAPPGTLYVTIPHYVVNEKGLKGVKQQKYLCLGVKGRGVLDELATDSPEEEEDDDDSQNNTEVNHAKFQPLSNWKDKVIRLTNCQNEGAVIEWVFVSYTDSHPSLFRSNGSQCTLKQADSVPGMQPWPEETLPHSNI